MNFICMKALFFFVIVFKSAASQGCGSGELNCISCIENQICKDGMPAGDIISCGNGTKCTDPQAQQCQILLNCTSLDECKEVGIFPDSTSKTNYYFCMNDGGGGFIKFDFSCPAGEYFDNTTSQCLEMAITMPTETTSTEMSTGSSSAEELSTTPIVDEPFTELTTETTSDFSTMEVSVTEIPLTSPSSTQSSNEPTNSNTSDSASSEASFSCVTPGVFQDPLNCKGYYRCSTSLIPFNYTCPGTSYFDETILKCSLTATSCKLETVNDTIAEITLKPTTSSSQISSITPISSITLAPETTTSVLANPETTKTTTPSVTPTTSAPFLCPSSGVFPNVADCKTYYRCSTTMVPFLFNCPGSSYFNEITKKCGLNMTPSCKTIMDDLSK